MMALRQRSSPGLSRVSNLLGVANRGSVMGFTLLEVMVALAVTALALAAGLRAAGVLTDNAERLSDVIAAQWCADNQLIEQRLRRSFPGVGESDFSCEQLGKTYAGKLVTRPTPNPGFRRVDAVVSDDKGNFLVTLSTVLGRQ
jgi:general secretion pathway protein I